MAIIETRPDSIVSAPEVADSRKALRRDFFKKVDFPRFPGNLGQNGQVAPRTIPNLPKRSLGCPHEGPGVVVPYRDISLIKNNLPL